jgi:hypothetical protein
MEADSAGGTEVVIQVPPGTRSVTVRVEFTGDSPSAAVTDGSPTRGSPVIDRDAALSARRAMIAGGEEPLYLGGSRETELPRLVAITDFERLAHNIGRREASLVLLTLQCDAAVVISDASSRTPSDLAKRIAEASQAAGAIEGVVLVGGLDVVPAFRVDTVSTLRAMNPGLMDDLDRWIVWSDDPYGNGGEQGAPALPVSRLPDARSGPFFFHMLQTSRTTGSGSFGVRNRWRPFVAKIAPEIAFLVSEPATRATIPNGSITGSELYMVLHGSESDGRSYWGEDAAHKWVEAVHVEHLVDAGLDGAVVFSGSCWGALTVDETATRAIPNSPLSPRNPQQSIALCALHRGALAFIGTTGSHWSPLPDQTNASYPLHEAFWRQIHAGLAPARALRDAKVAYAATFFGIDDVAELAIRSKTLAQFCCLGLGW